MSFQCETCNRSFGTREALNQHRRDSPAHNASFRCDVCNRSFIGEEALQQHIRDSPMHIASYDCASCNRTFGTDEALQQHLTNSPVHAPSFDCGPCNRSFGSEEALQQHLRDSPVHIPSHDCDTCNRSFGSEDALQQHVRDSPAHQQTAETPLNVFFRSFPTFKYDPSLPPATSYALLQQHERWRRKDPASKDAWNRYQEALEDELRMWYGEEDDLTAWHALCRAIGLSPPPPTCEKCEQAARRTHVNIVDLIEWGRKRGENKEPVQTFQTVAELRIYCQETGKVFRNTFDEENGNVVLRHLLRKIFRGPRSRTIVMGI